MVQSSELITILWHIFSVPVLQVWKSKDIYVYVYKCMYIKTMLFKYLHIKPRDWLPSQNYWNYLPQEHLDLKNLYSNTFQKLNNLWKEELALHPLLFIWVLLLGVMERPPCMSNTFPVNYDKMLFYYSFPPQFLIGLFYERTFMRETIAQWGIFVIVLGQVYSMCCIWVQRQQFLSRQLQGRWADHSEGAWLPGCSMSQPCLLSHQQRSCNVCPLHDGKCRQGRCKDTVEGQQWVFLKENAFILFKLFLNIQGILEGEYLKQKM